MTPKPPHRLDWKRAEEEARFFHEPIPAQLLARMAPGERLRFERRDAELLEKARKMFAGRTVRIDHSGRAGRPEPGDFSLKAFDYEGGTLFNEQY